eukprot:CAMPEP_0183417834 /NCGR_PEP_ID=MMETSP0370-20130417/24697_1 /TAXON_ID=268820 /ORGANISM="Peridinium aciculiferum, Strain PAER-2" /LENGTH=67 /DNA_ID=CAMNT_0025601467 /DNA_START=72 /DNA_END=271 /DNA_ORIENTATION=+
MTQGANPSPREAEVDTQPASRSVEPLVLDHAAGVENDDAHQDQRQREAHGDTGHHLAVVGLRGVDLL